MGKAAEGMDNYIFKPMETEAEMDGKGYAHYQSWQETYAGLVDPAFLAGLSLEKRIAAAHGRPGNTVIAKDGENVIGFTAYGPCRDEDLPGWGEVMAIYVLRAYQGQKVGRRLMEAALEKLSGYPKIALWVLKGNERAIGFYERCGFRFDGTERDIILGTSVTELRMIYQRK